MEPRIFISYSFQDRNTAELLRKELTKTGLDVIIDNYNYENSYFINTESLYNMNPGDFVLILISHTTENNTWYQYELKNFLNKNLSNRNITFVPIYLSKVNKVLNETNTVSFNLNNNFDKGIKQIIKYFSYSQFIKLDNLGAQEFEKLSKSLLEKMKFNIFEKSKFNDNGYDFSAESIYKDPFGGKMKIKWIVQCKYYKQSRPDLKTLKQIEYLLKSDYTDYNAVLITNGILTSAAYELLSAMENNVNIRIVDGNQLKNLLLKYPKVIEEFFHEGMHL